MHVRAHALVAPAAWLAVQPVAACHACLRLVMRGVLAVWAYLLRVSMANVV
jgi:hypothetical protein